MSEYRIRDLGIFALVVFFSIGFCHAVAAESSVSVSPHAVTASSGDTFTIEVTVDPAGSEVFGAEYKLRFDNMMLKATEQSKGTFLSRDGAETIEVLNNINNEIGVIEYGETRVGDPDQIGGVIDPGVLTRVTFEVIGSGTCDLELEVMLADSNARSIDAVINGGTCSVEGAGETATAKETSASTENAKQRPTEKRLPGFGALYSVTGLIAALLIMRKEFR